MADQKISQLTTIVTVDNATDLFPIVDTSVGETKKITPTALKTALALNNVDNTTDLNKPVSTATQTALNGKQDTLVSATNIKTVNSTSLLGSGDIVVGATPSGVAGAIQFSDGTAFASDAANLFFDNTNNRLGVGINAPTSTVQIKGVGSTSATNSLLVQNSAGTQLLNIRDDGFTTIGQNNQGISTHNITATNYIVCGSTSAHYFQLGAGLVLRSPADGVATFLNGGESTFNRINLGGTTSSFPAIKRNAAQIDFKLADDSTFATISSGGLNVNGNSITLVGAIGNTSAMRMDAGATTGLLRLSTTSVNIGGNTTNNASALLQTDSTTQGVLFPRMTTTQKNAISSPAAGLVVYDTTLNKLCVRTASAWETITSV